MIDSHILDSQFPTLKEMVYLNNAATGIPPVDCISVMKKYLDNKLHAIGSFEETLKAFESMKVKLSKLLGGEPSEYGVVPSTSSGLNTLAHGIEYPANANIVICDLEFPSNYIPWQNAARFYDIDLRVVKSKDGAIEENDLFDKIDENTRIVAISMTQFASGYQADIPDIAKAVHEYGGYLCVDIIQAAGWKDMDLPKYGVDFAAAQAAKWLLGPIGAGFVYANKKVVDSIKPRHLGWWGVEDMLKFEYADRTPLKGAAKFEVGSPAMVSYVGFNKTLDILLSIPSSAREKAALDNAEYLLEKLDELGIPYYEFDEKNQSPIISCAPDNVEDIQVQLHKENIHCSVRNGRLRVSPHFYNTFEDIDKLVERLR